MKGGVLKIGMTSDFHEALDPSREYYTIGWEFLRCCLARTLLGYNGRDADHGGTQVIPDVATFPCGRRRCWPSRPPPSTS